MAYRWVSLSGCSQILTQLVLSLRFPPPTPHHLLTSPPPLPTLATRYCEVHSMDENKITAFTKLPFVLVSEERVCRGLRGLSSWEGIVLTGPLHHRPWPLARITSSTWTPTHSLST